MASNLTPTYKGAYCSIVGCHRETVRDRDKVNFVRGYDLTNEETDREKVYEKANG